MQGVRASMRISEDIIQLVIEVGRAGEDLEGGEGGGIERYIMLIRGWKQLHSGKALGTVLIVSLIITCM